MLQSCSRDEPANHPTRRGISAPEVIIVVIIVVVVGLFLLVGLARQRETARSAGCQHNLSQIGKALMMYEQGSKHLPTVADPLTNDFAHSPGPLLSMLQELSLNDFSKLTDPKQRPPKESSVAIAETTIPGFVCPSDSNGRRSLFPAPVSYRATAGDEPDGRNGAFAPGRKISTAEIGARDGTGFTAAFSERLLGDGAAGSRYVGNYALTAGRISQESCPATQPGDWRGDAGRSWMIANWQSTLYNHTLTPNALPSCIASNGRAAGMGASSGHSYGVNLLFFDLSVRSFSSRVDPKIWREWANISSEADQAVK